MLEHHFLEAFQNSNVTETHCHENLNYDESNLALQSICSK